MTRQSAIRLPKANALAAMGAACALVLQLLFSGVAIGASPAAASEVFVCAQIDQGDPSSGSAPVAPLRHHVSCCILHQDSFDDPSHYAPVVHAAAAGEASLRPAPLYDVDVSRTSPELAPLSARAPPSRV